MRREAIMTSYTMLSWFIPAEMKTIKKPETRTPGIRAEI
jgi:uncharacterized protein with GYD domain